MNPPPFPEELLSAYLDDELSPDEMAEVEVWLAADPAHRAELEAFAAVRRQVRELPWLEMPPVLRPAASPLLGGRLTSWRRRSALRSNAFAGLTATVAVAVLAGSLVLGGGRPAEASPVPVDRVVDAHQGQNWTRTASGGDGTTAPAAYHEYRIVGVTRVEDGDMTGMRYSNGSDTFSVFERRGRVKWGSLEGGTTLQIDGDPAWFGEVRGYQVMVLQRGGRVYVVISDDRPDAEAVSREMPGDGDPSLWSRVTRRCHDTLHLFSAS